MRDAVLRYPKYTTTVIGAHVQLVGKPFTFHELARKVRALLDRS
jgi:hypothetical protein